MRESIVRIVTATRARWAEDPQWYDCECGNPDCQDHLFFRTGPVFVTDEDGQSRQEGPVLWVEATCITPRQWVVDQLERDEGPITLQASLMLEPAAARRLAWSLAREWIRPLSWRWVRSAWWRLHWKQGTVLTWLEGLLKIGRGTG